MALRWPRICLTTRTSRIAAISLCIQNHVPATTRPRSIASRHHACQERPARTLARLAARAAIQMHRLRTRVDEQENSQPEAYTHQTMRKETCIDRRHDQNPRRKGDRHLVPYSEHPIFAHRDHSAEFSRPSWSTEKVQADPSSFHPQVPPRDSRQHLE